MKKIKIAVLAVVACLLAVMLCSCAGETVKKVAYELPYYDGTTRRDFDAEDKPYYNDELWRRNTSLWEGADFQVLDDTERTGYYYAYSTGYNYYYSTDLENWNFGASFISLEGLSGAERLWAPEVLYNEDDETYYAFLAVRPTPDLEYEMVTAPEHMPIIATSKDPRGPFKPLIFEDRNPDYPQWYAKYCFFDMKQYKAAYEALNLPVSDPSAWEKIYTLDGGIVDPGWMRAFDFSPFEDPDTGKKYLYWSQSPGGTAAVEMIDWTTPDWSTFQVVATALYYTVDDYIKATNGDPSIEKVYYETLGAYCNEGPFVYKHNGKYYLTFSIGSGDTGNYSVMQAIADSPLGPFRKLTDAENGFIVSSDLGSNRGVSGPGHHSFIRTKDGKGDEKLLMCYHAQKSVYSESWGRCMRFDEIKWVETQGIDGETFDVMHLNGPTITVQPTFGVGREVGDITSRVKSATLVRGTVKEGSADNLIDGLIPTFVKMNQAFENKYVKETEISVTSTFELEFESEQELRALMIYNSKNTEKAFAKIKDIAFISENNGAERINYIKELEVDKAASYFFDVRNNRYDGIHRCSNVYAEFDLIKAKKIRFTVELPGGQERAAVGEVVVLGKY